MPNFLASYQSLIVSVIVTVILLALVIALFKLLRQVFLFYKQLLYKNVIEWTLLELRIPREVLKTPRAMEQFFINIHSLKNEAGDLKEKYIDGEVPLWWSLEIIGLRNEVHFYIRTPKKHRKIVESALYAQYPNIEVAEVKDYVKKIPETTKEIYESNENIFGSELNLSKEDYYPIITYERFYERLEMAQKEEKEQTTIDPLSVLIESLAGLHKEETIFIQILIAPVGDDWKAEGKDFVNEKLGKGKKKKGGGFNQIFSEWMKNLLWAPAEHPVWADKKESESKEAPNISDYEDMKAVEDKLSKHGFETLIRYIYIAPNPIFNMNFATKGVRSALNQYSSAKSNSFNQNVKFWTLIKGYLFPYVYINKRLEARKQRFLNNYIKRALPEKLLFGKFFTSHIFNFNNKSKTSILVTSELATIFHIPNKRILTAPHIERMESRKMGPPAGLPIFEEE
ncbi:MAG: hypothetical protein M1170_00420 [Patescibacteria group bacterium]|nr:hypothetical protein [Patescibacteria group bacterium]